MRALLSVGALVLAGCFPAMSPDDATFDEIRARCRQEARDAFYEADAGESAAVAAYHHCLARWGVL